MGLFCKICNNRRIPKWMKVENMTFWLCDTCGDFVDIDDKFIRKVAWWFRCWKYWDICNNQTSNFLFTPYFLFDYFFRNVFSWVFFKFNYLLDSSHVILVWLSHIFHWIQFLELGNYEIVPFLLPSVNPKLVFAHSYSFLLFALEFETLSHIPLYILWQYLT